MNTTQNQHYAREVNERLHTHVVTLRAKSGATYKLPVQAIDINHAQFIGNKMARKRKAYFIAVQERY